MDLVTGALGAILSSFAELLKDEYNLHKNIKKDIENLKEELEIMQVMLRNVGEETPEQVKESDKIWARAVRDISYDMDAIVDTFLIKVHSPEPHIKGITKSFIERMKEKVNKAWACHGISQEIKVMKERVKDMVKRRERYSSADTIAPPAKTNLVDSRLPALYTKPTDLVGIDESKGELVTRLTREDCTSTQTQQQRIISIVGFGGLGKTTLAKAVYDELKMKFNCNAFISVSRNPDRKKLLKDILYELDNNKYQDIHSTMLDERHLIDRLREFLQDKKYFIVIDDIWSMEPWAILRCALVDSNMRSQIIITTRIVGVAEKVGGYCYKLKPLTPESSKILFCRNTVLCEDKLPKQYSEISEKILNKCGGVPLAILTTSGVLANNLGNINVWQKLCESIGSGFGSNDDVEKMRKILSLSYYDLPYYLKPCLLYLSIFPEDYEIGREQLIWRWIAENFVQHGEGGQSLFDIAESYFNDLVNRSLIQPTYFVAKLARAYADRPQSCRVHDIVHDFICSLAREENFVTRRLDDSNQITPSSGSKIYRLSFSPDHTAWPPCNASKLKLMKLRSLTVFGPCVINSMLSSIPSYHLLRVLDLESCCIDGDPSLMFIGKLLQLRYLRLPDRLYTCELLDEIAKLQNLQTLDLSGYHHCKDELPPCILRLRQLMFLSVKLFVRLPAGFGNLTSLEELSVVRLESAQMAKELGCLTQLRVLNVSFKKGREDRWDESLPTAFVASLGKLRKLQILKLENDRQPGDLDGLTAECLGNLRYISMYGTTVMPRWINPKVLPHLSSLEIQVSQVRREDIQVLGTLKDLSYLCLAMNGLDNPKLGRFVIGEDAFPFLVECKLEEFPVVPSMFPPGAMRKLQTFQFYIDLDAFTAGGGDLASVDDLALGHLPSLRKVVVLKYFAAEDEETVSSQGDEVATRVKKKLRHEVDVHPNQPSLYISNAI